jgi:hypothetical protein
LGKLKERDDLEDLDVHGRILDGTYRSNIERLGMDYVGSAGQSGQLSASQGGLCSIA